MEAYNTEVINNIMINYIDPDIYIPDATCAYLRYLINPIFEAMKNYDSVENLYVWLGGVFNGELLDYIHADLIKDNNGQTVGNAISSIIKTLLVSILETTREVDNIPDIFTPWDIKKCITI